MVRGWHIHGRVPEPTHHCQAELLYQRSHRRPDKHASYYLRYRILEKVVGMGLP